LFAALWLVKAQNALVMSRLQADTQPRLAEQQAPPGHEGRRSAGGLVTARAASSERKPAGALGGQRRQQQLAGPPVRHENLAVNQPAMI
jgi:hypothetical protein